ncbi:hypothetical protein CY34DRAFT_329009 [Suillus luteus UH-Slu-Lm8-n1]|uniref:Uncharacterized protein n=1 Tax=Suillus luteus UH-Slu-Lm8-n1 TaxID=930992 RepID=A0A0C9ZPF3_9AGAM|nr:hypothetical protein CY34DRAFT_329009 [Suillus luteus UH-Slu-Lm8-n1]
MVHAFTYNHVLWQLKKQEKTGTYFVLCRSLAHSILWRIAASGRLAIRTGVGFALSLFGAPVLNNVVDALTNDKQHPGAIL